MADLRKLVQEIEAKRARGEVKDVSPEEFDKIESQAGLKDLDGKFKKDKTAPRPPARERMKSALSELDGMKKGGSTKKWIQSAIKKPGALRAQLGVKEGKPIPAKKLAAAAKKPGKLGQRARLAQTLKKMK